MLFTTNASAESPTSPQSPRRIETPPVPFGPGRRDVTTPHQTDAAHTGGVDALPLSPTLNERLRRLHDRYDDKVASPSRTLRDALERLQAVERDVGDPGSEVVNRVRRLMELMERHEADRERESQAAVLALGSVDVSRSFLTPARSADEEAGSAQQRLAADTPRTVNSDGAALTEPARSSSRSVRFSEDLLSPAAAATPTGTTAAVPILKSPQAVSRTRSLPGGGHVNTIKWRVTVPLLLGDAAHFPSLASVTFTMMTNVSVTASALTAAVAKAAPIRVNATPLAETDPVQEQLASLFADPFRFVAAVTARPTEAPSSAASKDGAVTMLDGEYALLDFDAVLGAASSPEAVECGVAEMDLFLLQRQFVGDAVSNLSVAKGLRSA